MLINVLNIAASKISNCGTNITVQVKIKPRKKKIYIAS